METALGSSWQADTLFTVFIFFLKNSAVKDVRQASRI